MGIDEIFKKSDEELLSDCLRVPDSSIAKSAKQLLEFRIYKQSLRYNRLVLLLSVVVGIATILSTLVAAATFREEHGKNLVVAIADLFRF